MAAFGVGGRGSGVIEDLTKQVYKFVALFDVDKRRAANTFTTYEKAKNTPILERFMIKSLRI